ncbi:hypothetical protein [Halanaerobacter jeridensis]|uniref:VCBS repeat-containing protein n=1 Tax=Halanaerobacter jeridensis TaxID=706427 RepID=A0A938XXE3_9FIRM|nr:hypothetical protein [Halanaerobacter jeridensis]MBM7557055.1 hypothetical protein [Halanaerobacter jeridensis]
MEIQTSQINLSSTHKFKSEYTKEESLKVWTRRPNRGRGRGQSDQVKLSDEAQKKLAKSQQGEKSEQAQEIVFEMSEEDKFKLELLKDMLEKIKGEKVEIEIAEKIVIKADKVVIKNQGLENKEKEKNWAVEYKYHESYTEEESTSFKAAGTVKTKDGRKIDFALNLAMNRKFSQEKNIRLVAGNKKLIDPLVLNLDGGAVELNSDKIEFDLNSDGQEEEIATLKSGSAFLALDKNKDGQINNGGELFGPTSGQGFAELAKYDDDNNQWIDEGDKIFSQLQLWAGQEKDGGLISLQDAGVGAIHLNSVSTPFELQDEQNQEQGVINRSSIYLTESGEAKTIQKIDLKA